MLHAITAKDEEQVRLENSDRSWKVSRLLSVASRLSPRSNTIMRFLLSGSLIGECEMSDWDSLWDTDLIKTEVLRDHSRLTD
jgi:hypothetical protein